MQATLSVVLVAGATMLARSLNKLEHQDFGYQVQGRVVVALNRPPATYTQPKLAALYRQLEERLEPVARRARIGAGAVQPAHRQLGRADPRRRPSRAEDERGSRRVVGSRQRELPAELRHRRSCAAAPSPPPTTKQSAPVAVVNEAFVKRFFKTGEDPLDQHFGLDLPENAGTFRIVGVVRDAKFAGFALQRPARPMFYVPLAQTVDYTNDLMQRIEVQSHFIGGIMLVTDTPAGVLEPVLTRALAEVDPNLTITSVRTMQQQVSSRSTRSARWRALPGCSAVVALLLAAIGLYGVTAYSVAQRTNEIGIRMALGADRGNVVELVLRGAFQRVVVGLVLGVPLAVGGRAPDLGAAVRRDVLGSRCPRGGGGLARHLCLLCRASFRRAAPHRFRR